MAGVNKAQFARDHKIPGGASMISQNISGNRPISLEAGIAYAAALGCSLADISPRLAAVVASAQNLSQSPPAAARTKLEDALDILAAACKNATPTARQNALDLLTLVVKDPEANAVDLIPIICRKLSGEGVTKTGTHN